MENNRKNVVYVPPQQYLDIWMKRFTDLYSGHEKQAEIVFERCIAHTLGIKEHNKPVGTCVSIGPSGSGKSYFWECIAESVHGNPGAAIMVNGGEYKHSHEVSKLIGAPPGYLGHRETDPVITNKIMDSRRGSSTFPTNFVIVDELDKAHHSVCDFFLSPMEKAQAKLANGAEVDFSNCFLAFTTNAGGDIYASKSLGLVKSSLKSDFSPRTALIREFSSPFMNRVKYIWMFHEYDETQKISAIKIQVDRLLQSYASNDHNSNLAVSPTFYREAALLKLDKNFGMRDLVRTAKSVIEKRCTDLAFGRTKKKTLSGEDIVDFVKVQNESNRSFCASM